MEHVVVTGGGLTVIVRELGLHLSYHAIQMGGFEWNTLVGREGGGGRVTRFTKGGVRALKRFSLFETVTVNHRPRAPVLRLEAPSPSSA